MKYRVVSLRRAEADIRHIVHWIASKSPQGAAAWLQAYEDLLERLTSDAATFSVAAEAVDCDMPLKHAPFRTRRGRTYRAVFTIVENEVRILRVRGPGQPPLQADEIM